MMEIFQRIIDHAIQKLKLDARLCGIAVGGSWINQNLDEFSDLDLVVVAHDGDYERVFPEFARKLERTVTTHGRKGCLRFVSRAANTSW